MRKAKTYGSRTVGHKHVCDKVERCINRLEFRSYYLARVWRKEYHYYRDILLGKCKLHEFEDLNLEDTINRYNYWKKVYKMSSADIMDLLRFQAERLEKKNHSTIKAYQLVKVV